MSRPEIRFQVELYNLIGKINGRTCAVGNGWLVARVIGGCRAETVRRFDADEAGARKFCDGLNRDFGVKEEP